MYCTKLYWKFLFFVWCSMCIVGMYCQKLDGVEKKVLKDEFDVELEHRNWITQNRYNLARLIMDAADFDDHDIKQHFDQLIAKKSIIEIINYLEEIDHSLIRTIYTNLTTSLQDNKIEAVITNLAPHEARELRQDVCNAFEQYLTTSDRLKIFKKRHCEIQ